MDRGEAITAAREKARYNMEAYGSWAQSVVLALQDTLGLVDDNLLRAATGMTGGIGGMRDTCGGLLGAAMMLGSICGRDRSDMDKKDRLNDTVFRTGKLYKWYEQKYGSTRCYDIKKFFGNGVYYDTNVPWQAEMAKQAGIPGKCSALVEETAEYAIEELWNIMGRQK